MILLVLFGGHLGQLGGAVGDIAAGQKGRQAGEQGGEGEKASSHEGDEHKSALRNCQAPR
ncbi:MAG: hypothetical protein VB133_15170 [Anaeromusa sp.]|uniref:hypothetical protein n=1 Tax=Anaeromusa sp. TaxID=1872520 RepID=UPI002B20DD28|nr:hypothetical protein [Anaeromusa sp.]MEA4836456.1 hypothetical protein [Anaeromusa sp.]